MKKKYIPNQLFADPSFVLGVISVLDLGGTLYEYNTSDSGMEADVKALKNDWRAVGEDIANSIEMYEQESVGTR